MQEPPPFDSVAVQSVVDPVVNVTDPVGVGNPVALVVTFAEYTTGDPKVPELPTAVIDV